MQSEAACLVGAYGVGSTAQTVPKKLAAITKVSNELAADS